MFKILSELSQENSEIPGYAFSVLLNDDIFFEQHVWATYGTTKYTCLKILKSS